MREGGGGVLSSPWKDDLVLTPGGHGASPSAGRAHAGREKLHSDRTDPFITQESVLDAVWGYSYKCSEHRLTED